MPAAQSVPESPSLGSRKRSIHEVDGAGNPPPSPKRCFPDSSSENQENRDPSLSLPTKSTLSPSNKNSFAVEIPVMQNDQSVASTSQQVGSGSPTNSHATITPATKKRKLSPASQQAKQQEKEEKERQKAEERHKKEEEKRLKEEEKKKREAEREEEKKKREEKKKAKEEEKAAKEAAKEEEKRRKEEEKQKKEKVHIVRASLS